MIEDVQLPYEILVRFGEDGAPRAAHVQYIRRVTMDGKVLKNEPLPAEPLALDNFPECDLMTQTQQAALTRGERFGGRSRDGAGADRRSRGCCRERDLGTTPNPWRHLWSSNSGRARRGLSQLRGWRSAKRTALFF